MTAPVPHPADAMPEARRLPDDSPALLHASSLEQLREDLAWQSWVHRLGAAWARPERQVARRAGIDLLEPSVWVASGIDGAGPISLAAVAADPGGAPRPVLGLVARDPGLVRATLYTALADEIREVSSEGEHLILDVGTLAVLLAERDVFVVFGFDAARVARRIARTPEARSLARHRRFRAALRRVPEGSLRGFVDVRAIAYHAAGMDPRWPGTTVAEARAQLTGYHRRLLRQDSGVVEDLVTLDRGLRASHEVLRDDPAARELRALLGAVEPTGLALARAGAGWGLRLAFGLGAGSALDRLLAVDRPTRTAHLDGEGTFVVRAGVDVDVLEEWLRAQREPLAGPRWMKGLRAMAGRGELLIGPAPEARAVAVAGWLGLRDVELARGSFPEITEGELSLGPLGMIPVQLEESEVVMRTHPGWEPRGEPNGSSGPRTRPLEVGGALEALAPLVVTDPRPSFLLAEGGGATEMALREDLERALDAWSARAWEEARARLRALGRVGLLVEHEPGTVEITLRWLPAPGVDWVEALAGALAWRWGRGHQLPEDDPDVAEALERWSSHRDGQPTGTNGEED